MRDGLCEVAENLFLWNAVIGVVEVRTLNRRSGGANCLIVALVGVALTVLFASLSLHRLYKSRNIQIEQWRDKLSQTSLVLNEHLHQTLSAADLALKSIADYVINANIGSAEAFRQSFSDRTTYDVLRHRSDSAPQISVATIVASNGDVINFTRSWPPPPINLADRDYFIALFNRSDLEVFLSAPVRNRGTGTWTFYLARKIRNIAGEAIGLALAGIECSYFTNFYENIDKGELGAISLLRRDGILLARHPRNDAVIGTSFAGNPIFQELITETRLSGTMMTSVPRSATDGRPVARMISPRKVKDYPIILNVTVTEDVILRLWWEEVRSTLLLTGLTSALLLCMTFGLCLLLERQRVMMESLSAARATAENAAAAKAQFLAYMSHEIRTPLNSVVGFCNLLHKTALNSEQATFAQMIGESADLLLLLINDVLDLSRLETGRLDLDVRSLDIEEVIESAIGIVSPIVGNKPIDLTSHVAKDVPKTVFGDRGRLTQVLINLLSNAIKYTPTGRIDIYVKFISSGVNQLRLRFEVIDTGVGISPADQERLFEPFERAVDASKSGVVGSGLGLAIAKYTVNLMRGTIGVTSALGQGSTFWLELPFGSEPVERLPRRDGLVALGKGSLCVLVAEDTPSSQLLLRTILEGQGHDVVVVSNGAAAVKAVRDGLFDLVLMDTQMPGLDGYEATLQIRQMPGGRASIPVIGLSAHAGVTDRRRALAAGMNDYIVKPFDIEVLNRVIGRLGTRPGLQIERGSQREGSGSVLCQNGVDVSMLERIFSAVRCEDFEVIRRQFFESEQDLLCRIAAAKRNRDSAAVRQAAHQLAGVLVQVGAKDAAAIAAALEFAAEAELSERICTLRSAMVAAREVIRNWSPT